MRTPATATGNFKVTRAKHGPQKTKITQTHSGSGAKKGASPTASYHDQHGMACKLRHRNQISSGSLLNPFGPIVTFRLLGFAVPPQAVLELGLDACGAAADASRRSVLPFPFCAAVSRAQELSGQWFSTFSGSDTASQPQVRLPGLGRIPELVFHSRGSQGGHEVVPTPVSLRACECGIFPSSSKARHDSHSEWLSSLQILKFKFKACSYGLFSSLLCGILINLLRLLVTTSCTQSLLRKQARLLSILHSTRLADLPSISCQGLRRETFGRCMFNKHIWHIYSYTQTDAAAVSVLCTIRDDLKDLGILGSAGHDCLLYRV